MTVQAPSRPSHPSPPPSSGSERVVPADGGMPARRVMVRWARRMLRRDWRSQLLVSLLLAVAVAVAVCGACVLYNTPAPTDPTLGTASTLWTLKGTPQAMAADLAALRKAAGPIDVVGHTPEQAPGLAQPVDYRAQSLNGSYTAHLLAIHRGRYPTGPDEAAVTSGVAQLLGLRLGGPIGLDGHSRTIVGIAENPNDLTDDFVLVSPSGGPAPRTESVFFSGMEHGPASLGLTTVDQRTGKGPNNDQFVVTTLVLAAATILLLLVAFVAAAGFAVLAHRRLRQLGMLAAVGATVRHLRLVMTATGLLVGVIAAGAGTVVGLLLWLPAASWTESATEHRVDRLAVPWYLIVPIVMLAVLMAAAAAWWPARAVSRVPITLALSGRPPERRSTHRPAVLAAFFLAAGLGCLAVAEKKNPLLIIVGTVATALAMLFAGPLAIRLLAAAGARAPVAVRLALRDLVRHQGRSGAAVAALSLALGIPVALVIITTGVQSTPATGNLSDRQLLVRLAQPDQPESLIPIRTEAQLRALAAQIDRMAAALPDPTVLPLDMAYDPAIQKAGSGRLQAQELGIPVGGHQYSSVLMYVATPDLLRLAGADPASIPPSTDVVTSQTQHLVVPGRHDAESVSLPTTRIRGSHYTSLPNTLLTAAALTRHHLTTVRAGWLIESARPLTGAQLAAARHVAADAGLTIESRDGQQPIQTIRASATTGGVLLALAVLAMTVGLIRSEGAGDLRTLTATGATAGIRRSLTAATSGGLALLGVLLGTAGAGLGLAAVYRHDLAVFGRVPLVYPLVFLVGVPLAAAAAGWLLAGKEPPAIARRMSE